MLFCNICFKSSVIFIYLFSVFLETHPDHLRVWNEVQDNFLLQLLHTGLNSIPSPSKKLTEMNENNFDKWLKNQDFTKQATPKYDIAIPVVSVKSENKMENNAATAGTAAIFEEFGKEFGIPCEHAKDYLPFDSKNQTFDLSAARTHHEFLASLKIHKTEMARTVQQLNEVEKAFNLPTTDFEPESTVSISTTSQQKVDAKFKNTFDKHC